MLVHIAAIIINAVIMCGAGLIMLFGAIGKIPLKKSPEANQEFLEKYSRLMIALGVVLVLLGLANTVIETVRLFK